MRQAQVLVLVFRNSNPSRASLVILQVHTRAAMAGLLALQVVMDLWEIRRRLSGKSNPSSDPSRQICRDRAILHLLYSKDTLELGGGNEN